MKYCSGQGTYQSFALAGRQTNGISVQYFFGDRYGSWLDCEWSCIPVSLPPPTKYCPLPSGLQCSAVLSHITFLSADESHIWAFSPFENDAAVVVGVIPIRICKLAQKWSSWSSRRGESGRTHGHDIMDITISFHRIPQLLTFHFRQVKSQRRTAAIAADQIQMYLLEWSERETEKLISYSYQFSHISRSTSTTAFCPSRKFSCKNLRSTQFHFPVPGKNPKSAKSAFLLKISSGLNELRWIHFLSSSIQQYNPTSYFFLPENIIPPSQSSMLSEQSWILYSSLLHHHIFIQYHFHIRPSFPHTHFYCKVIVLHFITLDHHIKQLHENGTMLPRVKCMNME